MFIVGASAMLFPLHRLPFDPAELCFAGFFFAVMQGEAFAEYRPSPATTTRKVAPTLVATDL
jgi:hypothetical protein